MKSRQKIRPCSSPIARVLVLLALLGAFGSISHKVEAAGPTLDLSSGSIIGNAPQFAEIQFLDENVQWQLFTTCTDANINLFSVYPQFDSDPTQANPGAYFTDIGSSEISGNSEWTLPKQGGDFLARIQCIDGDTYDGQTIQLYGSWDGKEATSSMTQVDFTQIDIIAGVFLALTSMWLIISLFRKRI